MERFRVSIGDHVLHTIGVSEPGVLSVTLSAVIRETSEPEQQHECSLRLGGLESSTNTFVDWPDYELEPGDMIVIEVLPEGPFDEPVSKRQDIQEVVRRSKADYVRQLAGELGWTITENDTSSDS
ncbi:hypothetical protein [Luteolibacter soli]|uniref:Uncharacterized protein n=1 Tax=Luteolibacter soli TaxID=3135280 RepID=A0ABU9AT03_9BACT